MRSRNVIAFLFAITLFGCANEPVALNYYLLHSPDFKAQHAAKSVRGRIHLQQLKLPDYLKQRSLAMQTGPTNVFFSPQHIWAEPLSSGLVQALTEILWRESQVLAVPLDVYPNDNDILNISIQIDDLIATYQGEVILKGQYWIYPHEKDPEVRIFDFRHPLEEDGFEHAVEKMRLLIGKLSRDIADDVVNN
ncbi:membrane integrity-associated transporter subunit PqiC [Alteromonas pelagimontana]|uniref:Membrane integrity-associated transporter subunit PqiC n=1 Tax=Alteromonas pelagimontana TaxID=1858656 RepID=A0A6M4M9H5_9ALTE|nr:ABC-type transport auxiliary lipoprotein family protein [Alteromonas pelagimontana]QJR79811.1 membrane integrity-associated transporter subunit PqiC [Alteromonas pelagimontana]